MASAPNTLTFTAGGMVAYCAPPGGRWRFQPGTKPYRASFLISAESVVIAKGNDLGVLTITAHEISAGDQKLEIADLVVESHRPSPQHQGWAPGHVGESGAMADESLYEIVLQDSRFYLGFGSVVRAYNSLFANGLRDASTTGLAARNTTVQATIRDGGMTYLQVVQDIVDRYLPDTAKKTSLGTDRLVAPEPLGAMDAIAPPLEFDGQTPGQALDVVLGLCGYTIFCLPDGRWQLAKASHYVSEQDISDMLGEGAKRRVREVIATRSRWTERPTVWRYFFPIDVQRVHYTWVNVIPHDGFQSDGTTASATTNPVTGQAVKAGEYIDVSTAGFLSDYGYANFTTLSKDAINGFSNVLPATGAVHEARRQALNENFMRTMQISDRAATDTVTETRQVGIERFTPMFDRTLDGGGKGTMKITGHRVLERGISRFIADEGTVKAALTKLAERTTGSLLSIYEDGIGDISANVEILDPELGVIRLAARTGRTASFSANLAFAANLSALARYWPYTVWDRTGDTTATKNYLKVKYVHRLRRAATEAGIHRESHHDWYMLAFRDPVTEGDVPQTAATQERSDKPDALTTAAYGDPNGHVPDVTRDHFFTDGPAMQLFWEEGATLNAASDEMTIYPQDFFGPPPTDGAASTLTFIAKTQRANDIKKRALLQFERDLAEFADTMNAVITLAGLGALDYNKAGVYSGITVDVDTRAGVTTTVETGSFVSSNPLIEWARSIDETLTILKSREDPQKALKSREY